MAVDFASIAKEVDAALKEVGLPVKVTRGATSVATAYGVFVERKDAMDSNEPHMQTTVKSHVLKLSGLAKPPLIGDTVSAGKDTFTVASVETTRPTTTTLIYTLELT